jgi:serine-type D-Ala-D-Ala carboxypeptidase (penicillin-binding protein 5/6)
MKQIRGAVLFVWLFGLAAGAAQAQIETPANYAILMDAETGLVMFEKNADELMAPASMSKLMTVEMLFHRLKNGDVSMTDKYVVSENAWRKGGAASGSSTMFAKVNSEVPVEALLRGVIVQSGNDASIAIAEGIGGTEEAFAQMMTERARTLGLRKSNFANATGWPHPEHLTTARELAMLARHIIREYPEYYKLYAETDYTWNGIKQGNRNPLLYSFPGADGLKTGHTEDSGYGLVASAERDGRRVIMVVNGLESINQRASESRRLMALAFTQFDKYAILKSGQVVGEAEVWMGVEKTVPLAVASDVTLILDRQSRRGMKVETVHDAPLKAPIESGREVGKVRISIPGRSDIEAPLKTAGSVPAVGLTGKLAFALQQLLFGDITAIKNAKPPAEEPAGGEAETAQEAAAPEG